MQNSTKLTPSTKDLGGGFQVARLVPTPRQRHIGPFVFIDHMGPVRINQSQILSVRPHPHIGLATMTYLLSGSILHRDSLGYVQRIAPGAINWMTAGKGIVHSERTPKEEQVEPSISTLEGIQVWVALPKSEEDCEPDFTHYPADLMPMIQFGSSSLKILLGSFQKHQSPVITKSLMIYWDWQVPESISESDLKSTILTLGPDQIFSANDDWTEDLRNAPIEIGFYILSGQLTAVSVESQNDQELPISRNPSTEPPSHSMAGKKGDCLVFELNSFASTTTGSKAVTQLQVKAKAGTRVIILGGPVFPEKRHIWWNLVSTDKAKIHQAAQAWKDQHLGQVPGENEFIPLPTDPLP